ncbi:hypothetical protein [Longimicrobium sp.]|uniref:hypothetical protein n=1 Tax=Longimicrobium sp. TaxID=2029185 RepID=UPI002F93F253
MPEPTRGVNRETADTSIVGIGAQVAQRATAPESDAWRYADAFESLALLGKDFGVLSHCPDEEHASARLDDVLDALAAVPPSLCATVEQLCPAPLEDPNEFFAWLIAPSTDAWGGLSAKAYRLYAACCFAGAFLTPTPDELRAFVDQQDRLEALDAAHCDKLSCPNGCGCGDRLGALDALHQERERQREAEAEALSVVRDRCMEPEYPRLQVLR